MCGGVDHGLRSSGEKLRGSISTEKAGCDGMHLLSLLLQETHTEASRSRPAWEKARHYLQNNQRKKGKGCGSSSSAPVQRSELKPPYRKKKMEAHTSREFGETVIIKPVTRFHGSLKFYPKN
jgi:hypothetical protein